MGHLLACTISRADLLADALYEEREALDLSLPTSADGWGAGFYQAGEALHRKLPQPIDGRIEWNAVLEGIRSHVVLAHVREATVGDRRADNTQPFRMRQWLFAHVGEITGFAAVREPLFTQLPDFLRRSIRGQTDSELLFQVVLSFLHDAGQLDAVDVTDAAVVGALRSTVSLVDRHCRQVGATPGSLTLALTNGRQLYALRRGRPLCIAQRDRLSRRSGDPVANRDGAQMSVRYAIVATCNGEPSPPGYRVIADGEVLAVDRELNVSTHAL
jgi:glutamine amidotransferase